MIFDIGKGTIFNPKIVNSVCKYRQYIDIIRRKLTIWVKY